MRPCSRTRTTTLSPAGMIRSISTWWVSQGSSQSSQPWRTSSKPVASSMALPRHCRLRWTSGAKRPPSIWDGNRSASAVVAGAARNPADARSRRGSTGPNGLVAVRPPSASPIVCSLSKPPVSPHNSWNASVRSMQPETPICRRFCIPRCRRSTACHAEGRGFESLQPLRSKPAPRAGFRFSAHRRSNAGGPLRSTAADVLAAPSERDGGATARLRRAA